MKTNQKLTTLSAIFIAVFFTFTGCAPAADKNQEPKSEVDLYLEASVEHFCLRYEFKKDKPYEAHTFDEQRAYDQSLIQVLRDYGFEVNDMVDFNNLNIQISEQIIEEGEQQYKDKYFKMLRERECAPESAIEKLETNS